MKTSPPPKKKIALNVYLLKPNPASGMAGLWPTADILARSVAVSGKVKPVKTDAFQLGTQGSLGTLLIRKPITEIAPDWLTFIQPGMQATQALPKLTNKSVSALLVVVSASRQFAIAFGHGRFMINPTLIEDRFGIRTVLNSISENEVASIDRQTFDAAPRISRTQTIKLSSISDYVINAEQDLLRGLVGKTKAMYAPVLGTMLAGIDSLKTSVAIDVSGLDALLKTALNRSKSKDYLAKDSFGNPGKFAWVDNLQAVSDRTIIAQLDTALWAKMSADDLSRMWMAVPDIVDWSEITGFAYTKEKLRDNELATMLDLAEFKATLKAGADIGTLKRHQIFQVLSGLPPKPLIAFKCIYAEIQQPQGLFILNVGTWYKVESAFQTAVERYFTDLPRKKMVAPFFAYAHAGEGAYNEDVCAKSANTLAMLDRQMIKFGGSHDKIEVCDIYLPKSAGVNGEFIHVKRGRSSATLSHLFAQGLVASTLLVKEQAFVAQVNKQLVANSFPALPLSFKALGYDIVYAIVDGEAGEPLDLPFFSKVTLHAAGRSIAAFGYGVKIMHIPETTAHIAATAVKAAAKKATAATKKSSSAKPSVKSRVSKKAANAFGTSTLAAKKSLTAKKIVRKK